MPAGRPSSYKPEYAKEAEKLCALGATDAELADFFDVDTSTIWRWQSRHPEFCNAIKAAKAEADARVERSLYQRAVGYTHDAVKIFNANGVAMTVPYREHQPPDTAAAFIWLKNRQREKWRDKHEVDATVEHKGEAVDPVDIARRIAFAFAKAKAESE